MMLERVSQGMLRMVVVEMLRAVDLQLGMAVVLAGTVSMVVAAEGCSCTNCAMHTPCLVSLY